MTDRTPGSMERRVKKIIGKDILDRVLRR